MSSVRLVPGLCLPSGHIPGPAHASIFGHTQFSQFPQTAPSPQSRLDIDRDNTTHKSYYWHNLSIRLSIFRKGQHSFIVIQTQRDTRYGWRAVRVCEKLIEDNISANRDRMAQSSYRRHCKNLFSDCASYGEPDTDDDNATLSPLSPSIPSSTSSVTVSSISAVHNMVLIIVSSITVSVISLYSVVIIHRSQTCLIWDLSHQSFFNIQFSRLPEAMCSPFALVQ